MNYSRFLRDLHKRLPLSISARARHKQIIRFHDRMEFLQFFDCWKQTKQTHSRLKQIQPLPIIQGFACPIESFPDPTSLPRTFRMEEDTRVRVHQPARSVPDPLAPPDNIRIPWGIRRIEADKVRPRGNDRPVKIGIIDTGMDYLHPNLRSSASFGINLLQPHAFPYDDNGHGTHIAGTIAASGDIYGFIGIAPQSTLHPVKAFDYRGAAYVSDIIRGIDWCTYHKMDIINMSFGMTHYSEALDEAVRNAESAGAIIIASSGNEQKKRNVDYPARFPRVISVGATTRDRTVAPFSNQGRRIDIFAPGDRIWSTWPRGRYHVLSGTSMATSHVTGVVALMLARYPSLTVSRIKSLLQQTATPLRANAPQGRHLPKAGEINAVRIMRLLHSTKFRRASRSKRY